jgi:hypothetical protein
MGPSSLRRALLSAVACAASGSNFHNHSPTVTAVVTQSLAVVSAQAYLKQSADVVATVGGMGDLFGWLVRSLRARMFILTLLVLAVTLKFVRGKVAPTGDESKKIETEQVRRRTVRFADQEVKVNADGRPVAVASSEAAATATVAASGKQSSAVSASLLSPSSSPAAGLGLRHRPSADIHAAGDVAPVGSSNDIRTPVFSLNDDNKSDKHGVAPMSWEVVEDVLDSEDDDDDSERPPFF